MGGTGVHHPSPIAPSAPTPSLSVTSAHCNRRAQNRNGETLEPGMIGRTTPRMAGRAAARRGLVHLASSTFYDVSFWTGRNRPVYFPYLGYFAESHRNRTTDSHAENSLENRITNHRKTESHTTSAQEC